MRFQKYILFHFLRYGKQYYRLSIEHTCWKTNEGLLRKKYEGSVTGQQSKIREIIKAIKKWNNANDKNSTFD